MTFLNKICPKCGNTGQVYFSFNDDDGTWECTCYKCSKDFTDNQIIQFITSRFNGAKVESPFVSDFEVESVEVKE
jgi:hypothetical protein